MTLDKAERERVEEEFSTRLRDAPVWETLEWMAHQMDAANARIEELEEALHARRLRCEDLELGVMLRRDKAWEADSRAEGYRKAAIILRNLGAFWESQACNVDGCSGRARKDRPYCWRHR